MRYAAAPLITYLNTNTVIQAAWCYTITLKNATIYRWTGAEIPLTVGGRTFTAQADNSTTQPGIKRGAIRHVRGMEVQTMDLTLLCGQTVLMGGIPLPLFAHNGGLDGARVMAEWVPMGPGGWGDTSLGGVVMFEGAVADVKPETTQVLLKTKADTERLQQPWPRNLVEPGCGNSFGDAGCGQNLVALTVAGTATGSPTAYTIPSALGQAAGYFAMGTLTMTSGVCAGATRTVSAFSAGQSTLSTPLPATPAAGDTFTVTPGCARTWAACGVWANQTRFRGCPWVPPPETTR